MRRVRKVGGGESVRERERERGGGGCEEVGEEDVWVGCVWGWE